MDNQDRILYKSNKIINISNRLSFLAHKTFNNLLLDNQNQKSLEIKTSIQNLEHIFGKDQYSGVVRILTELRAKEFKFIDDKLSKHLGKCGHINEFEIRNGDITVLLSSKLFDLMTLENTENLTAGYTGINLDISDKLETRPGCYFYEYFGMLKGKKDYADRRHKINPASRPMNMTLEQVKHVTNTNYQQFYKLKTKTVDIAINDINKNTPQKIILEPVYNKKTVVSINFYLSKKSQEIILPKQELFKPVEQEPQPTIEPIKQIEMPTGLPAPVLELINGGARDKNEIMKLWNMDKTIFLESLNACKKKSSEKPLQNFVGYFINTFNAKFDKKDEVTKRQNEQDSSKHWTERPNGKPPCTLTVEPAIDEEKEAQDKQYYQQKWDTAMNSEEQKEIVQQIDKATECMPSLNKFIGQVLRNENFNFDFLVANKPFYGFLKEKIKEKFTEKPIQSKVDWQKERKLEIIEAKLEDLAYGTWNIRALESAIA